MSKSKIISLVLIGLILLFSIKPIYDRISTVDVPRNENDEEPSINNSVTLYDDVISKDDAATDKKDTKNSSEMVIAAEDDKDTVKAISEDVVDTNVTKDDGYSSDTDDETIIPIAVEGVSLDKTSITLILNNSETLIPVLTPANASNRAVVWTSSNPEVISVTNQGLVRGLSLGTATITVITEDGGYTASCTVEVIEEGRKVAPGVANSVPGVIKVTGLTLNKDKLSLQVGSSQILSVDIQPQSATNKTVKWKSDNEVVAVVDQNGRISALAIGTARIIVTSEDCEFTAICQVEVTEPVLGKHKSTYGSGDRLSVIVLSPDLIYELIYDANGNLIRIEKKNVEGEL